VKGQNMIVYFAKRVSSKYLLIFAGFIILSSCQIDPIIFKAKHFEPKLELKCIFYQGDTIRFTLTRSVFSPFGLDEELIYIDGANADLFEDGEYVGSFYQVPCNGCENYTYDGYYKIDYLPISGSSYRIEVSAIGYPTIQAETEIPLSGVNVFNLKVNRQYFDVQSTEFYDLGVELFDGLGVNHYLMHVDYEGIILGSTNGDTINRWVYKRGFQLSQNYLVNNLEPHNGSSFRSIVFSDNYFSNSFLNIELKELERLSIDLDQGCNFENVYCKRLFKIHIGNITKELYDYLYTTALQSINYSDPFSEPVNIISNIENGHGIFAGYNKSTYPIFIDIL